MPSSSNYLSSFVFPVRHWTYAVILHLLIGLLQLTSWLVVRTSPGRNWGRSMDLKAVLIWFHYLYHTCYIYSQWLCPLLHQNPVGWRCPVQRTQTLFTEMWRMAWSISSIPAPSYDMVVIYVSMRFVLPVFLGILCFLILIADLFWWRWEGSCAPLGLWLYRCLLTLARVIKKFSRFVQWLAIILIFFLGFFFLALYLSSLTLLIFCPFFSW